MCSALASGAAASSSIENKKPTINTSKWAETPLPFRPFNITAINDSMWICGLDETIAVSVDGGATWQIRHQRPNGEVLLRIAFVDAMVGHAAGTGGALFYTDDGGKTWSSHSAGATIEKFSFADSMSGIADVNGVVKLTADGGGHWQDAQLRSDEKLKNYSDIQSLAALSPPHYAVALREHAPGGQDILASTTDSGKTWTATHLENTVAGSLFVRDGEYWNFGIEYLGREHNPGGGYSVPVSLHSADGQHWQHGLRAVKETRGCTAQGCFQPYGVIEATYGTSEKIWSLPQDLPTTPKWAIALGRVCVIDQLLRCGSAVVSEAPQPPPDNAKSDMFQVAYSQAFTEGCLDCKISLLEPDPSWAGRGGRLASGVAEIIVNQNGSVRTVSVQGIPSKPVSDTIVQQISDWILTPAHNGDQIVESKLHVELELICSPGFPGRPETSSCSARTAAMDMQPLIQVTNGLSSN